MDKDSYNKFINQSYSAKSLLENHSLDEYGMWQIYGEDKNCDMGGPHSEPYLTTLEGKLDDVIKHAVNLPGFWSWGSGGRIVKAEVKKVGAHVPKKEMRKVDAYRADDNSTIQREYGRTDNGVDIGGRWVLRDSKGKIVDFSGYINDLAEQYDLKIKG